MAQAYNAAPYPGTMADKMSLEDYQCSLVVLPEGLASLQSLSIAGEA
jgi:hypothetical protein